MRHADKPMTSEEAAAHLGWALRTWRKWRKIAGVNGIPYRNPKTGHLCAGYAKEHVELVALARDDALKNRKPWGSKKKDG